MKTPSNLQIGDKVNLNFLTTGRLTNCVVDGVSFTKAKVYYDILIPLKIRNKKHSTLIYNVDSAFIELNK